MPTHPNAALWLSPDLVVFALPFLFSFAHSHAARHTRAMPLEASNARVRIAYKNSYYLVPIDFILRGHPGGQRLILPYVNQDITQAFLDAKHSDEAVHILEQWMEGAPLIAASAGEANARGASREDAVPLVGRLNEGRHAQLLWNALVCGIAGASVMAAVLTQQ